MDSNYQIRWTDESIQNLENILDYIKITWTENEVNNFKSKLSYQLKIIQRFPMIFPASEYNSRLRKAVMSKQTSLFYEFKDDIIYIVSIFDNRQNPKRIK
jgi:plasmid stabilization system protein ParE